MCPTFTRNGLVRANVMTSRQCDRITRVSCLALLAACTTMPGCADSNEPALKSATERGTAIQQSSPALRTRADSYTLTATEAGYQGIIEFSFHNPTDQTVYIANCNGENPPELQKLIDGKWVTAWRGYQSSCSDAPITVGPHQQYRHRFGVFGGFPSNDAYPKFLVPEIGGTYRLLWHKVGDFKDHRVSTSLGAELPLESRISNQFQITVGP